MKSPYAYLLSLVILAPAARVYSQSAVISGVGGGTVQLEAVDGGNAFARSGVAPGTTENTIDTSIRFSYLQPYWSHSSLALTVPSGSNPGAFIVGGTDNLPSGFAFVPKLDAKYDLASLGITAAASVEFISVTGKIERTLSSNVGTADLNASDTTTILVANLVEISKVVRVADFLASPHLERDTVEFGLGSRFTSIDQTYRATLRSGGSLSNAEASENFAGLGLTSAIHWTHPCTDLLSLYSFTRGSLILGYNNRKSVVSLVSANTPAANFTNTLIENKTDVVPIGEFEFGVERAVPLGARDLSSNKSFFFIRAGCVSQFWCTTGFLSATPNNVSFGKRSFYLLGFSLVAGVQF